MLMVMMMMSQSDDDGKNDDDDNKYDDDGDDDYDDDDNVDNIQGWPTFHSKICMQQNSAELCHRQSTIFQSHDDNDDLDDNNDDDVFSTWSLSNKDV